MAQETSFDVSWAFCHLLCLLIVLLSFPHPIISRGLVVPLLLVWWQRCRSLVVLKLLLFPSHKQLLTVVVLGVAMGAVVVESDQLLLLTLINKVI